MKNIVQFFLENVEKYPQKVAIIDNNKQITYKELYQKVVQNAAFYQSKGLGAGDRILVFIPMSIELYCHIIAIFYIGAVAVFVDEWSNLNRLKQACTIAKCKALIAPQLFVFIAQFIAVVRNIPIKLSTREMRSLSNKYNAKMWEINSDAPALITFTTGSTGTPKAANRTHQFLKHQFDALIHEVNPQSSDIDLVTLPVVLLLNLGVGATSVIGNFNPKKIHRFNPKYYAQLVENEKVNRITSSPHFVLSIGKQISGNTTELQSVKRIFTGGAPVFPTDAELLNKAFHSAEINILYGSTEAEPMSSITANELSNQVLEKGLAVGSIFINAQIRIIQIIENEINIESETDWQKIVKPIGEIGEIIVSGNHVLASYFNSPIEFKMNKIVDNQIVWHRTGDAGYVDTNGRLFLTGRCKTMIWHNNIIISPFLVEYQLMQIAGIECGTVLKINNSICLIVEKKKSSSKMEVETALSHTSIYFDKVLYISKIPKDKRHYSKIDYEALKLKLGA